MTETELRLIAAKLNTPILSGSRSQVDESGTKNDTHPQRAILEHQNRNNEDQDDTTL